MEFAEYIGIYIYIFAVFFVSPSTCTAETCTELVEGIRSIIESMIFGGSCRLITGFYLQGYNML